jgi:colicin import membrane protein
MAWPGSPLNTPTLAAAAGPALRPTEPDAWGPGMALALAAHLLLVAALAWGVNWRSHTEEAQEAELWSAIPEAEAPPPAPVVVPQPAETPPPEPPPPVAEPVPDLVIGKKPVKEPKVKPERKPAEPKEVFDSTPPKPRKADPTQPPADLKARQLKEAKDAKDKAARDQAAQEKLAKQQAEQAAAALEAQRLRNLNDIVKRAGGGQGSANASGQAARSAGPSAGYRGRLIALFKRNIINFSIDDVPGNPEAVVDLVVAPDGTILSKTLRTPSGVASWDEAVLRGIERTEMLPPDETGRVQPRMTIAFKPKDY